MPAMLNDIRYAIRSLRKNPGFALTAIFSIALGIGPNTAIFSLQDGLLLRPLAVENPAEVVSITSRPKTARSRGSRIRTLSNCETRIDHSKVSSAMC